MDNQNLSPTITADTVAYVEVGGVQTAYDNIEEAWDAAQNTGSPAILYLRTPATATHTLTLTTRRRHAVHS